MPEIQNVNGVVNALIKIASQKTSGNKDQVSVVVGYTAAYAAAVHENVGMVLKGKPRPKVRGRSRGSYWDPQGIAQAKFLEGPARDMSDELGDTVAKTVAGGGTLLQGLYVAGLRLQRESQKRVPVDRGNLKNSAFTRKE